MAEELSQQPGGPSVDAGSSVSASAPQPQYDPEYIRRLESYYQQTAPFLQQIEPVYEDLRPLIEDQDARELWKRSRQAYETFKTESKPRLTAEQQAVVDVLMPYIEKPAKYVEQLEQQQQAELQRRAKEYSDGNLAYAQKLLQDPALGKTHEERFQRVSRLANYAGQNGLSVEQAHRELYGEAPQAPAPEPVVEDAAPSRPGIPQAQKPQRNPEDPIDVFEMVRSSVAAAQKSRAS